MITVGLYITMSQTLSSPAFMVSLKQGVSSVQITFQNKLLRVTSLYLSI